MINDILMIWRLDLSLADVPCPNTICRDCADQHLFAEELYCNCMEQELDLDDVDNFYFNYSKM
jgi:hypothetical protein